MRISDNQRAASPTFTVHALKAVNTRQQAADYLADHWGGWIAAPMLTPIAHGGWAQLTLACLAVEASAYFWKPYTGWGGMVWNGHHMKALSLHDVKRVSEKQLSSAAAFCYMFKEVFDRQTRLTLPTTQLAEVTYKVFRCGLAHRGLSKDSSSAAKFNWLGLIDSQDRVFLDLSSPSQHVLSIDPQKFAVRLNRWFLVRIVMALRNGTSSTVDAAFKEWCEDRWSVPTAQWSF